MKRTKTNKKKKTYKKNGGHLNCSQKSSVQLGVISTKPTISENAFYERYSYGKSINKQNGGRRNKKKKKNTIKKGGNGYYLALDKCPPGGLSTIKGYDNYPIFPGQLHI